MTEGIVWKKNSTNTFHPLTTLYTYCHMSLICNYFGHNWMQMMCYHMLNIWLFKLLLFWNNLRHSIQILGWSYVMTHGLM